MIKIIKQGKTRMFAKTCQSCGCEFEYDDSDLNIDYGVGLTPSPPKYNIYVVCPCCGKRIYHGMTQSADPTIASPEPYHANAQYAYDCDKCPNKPDPNKITVGDTPCTWCKKRQPYCSGAAINHASTSCELRAQLEPAQTEATSECGFTEEEIEVVSDYLLRKMMRLEESNLKDSRCYPLIASFRTKLLRKYKNNIR